TQPVTHRSVSLSREVALANGWGAGAVLENNAGSIFRFRGAALQLATGPIDAGHGAASIGTRRRKSGISGKLSCALRLISVAPVRHSLSVTGGALWFLNVSAPRNSSVVTRRLYACCLHATEQKRASEREGSKTSPQRSQIRSPRACRRLSRPAVDLVVRSQASEQNVR